jgi:hypothetical protein
LHNLDLTKPKVEAALNDEGNMTIPIMQQEWRDFVISLRGIKILDAMAAHVGLSIDEPAPPLVSLLAVAPSVAT